MNIASPVLTGSDVAVLVTAANLLCESTVLLLEKQIKSCMIYIQKVARTNL